MYVVPRKYIFKFSSNSEAKASELLENIEDMFRYSFGIVVIQSWTNDCICGFLTITDP